MPGLLNAYMFDTTAPPPASHATYVDSTHGTGTTVTAPSGMTTGDHLLIFYMESTASSFAEAVITGFDHARHEYLADSGGASGNAHIFMREIDGSEGSSFTVTTSGSTDYLWVAVAYRGGTGLPALIAGTHNYPAPQATIPSRVRAPVTGTVLHVFFEASTNTTMTGPVADGVTVQDQADGTYNHVLIADEVLDAGDHVFRTALAARASNSAQASYAFMIPDDVSIPAVVGWGSGATNGTNATCSIPSTAQVGDMFVVGFQNTDNWITAGPPGFTLLGAGFQGGGSYYSHFWWGYKILTSGDISAGSVSVSSGSQVNASAGLLIRNPPSSPPQAVGRQLQGYGTNVGPVAQAAANDTPALAISSLMFSSGGAVPPLNNDVAGLAWDVTQVVAAGYGGVALGVQSVPANEASVAPSATCSSSGSAWMTGIVLFDIGDASDPIDKSYDDVILADDPVLYWKMADQYLDDSGNGIPPWVYDVEQADGGPQRLGAPVMPSGKGSFTFLDVNHIALTGPVGGTVPSALNVSSFSVEGWFVLASTSSYVNLFNRDGNSWRGWNLYVKDGQLNGFDGGSDKLSTGAAFSANTPHHVVATCDGTTVKFYLDGSLNYSFSASGGWTTNATTGSGNNQLTVGASLAGTGSFNFPMGGWADHFAFYDQVLDSTQVAAHYAAGAPPTYASDYDTLILADSPTVFYPGDDSWGPTVLEDAANSHDGLINTNPWFPQQPLVEDGSHSVYPHSGSIVRTPTTSQTDLNDPNFTTHFSHETWFRPQNVSGNAGIITRWQNGGGLTDGLMWINSSGYLECYWKINGSDVKATASTALLIPGQKHHLVSVYDGAHLLLYVNGVLVGSASATGAAAQEDGNNIDWGAYGGGSYYSTAFMHKMALYNFALTPRQILEHYWAGARSELKSYTDTIMDTSPVAYYRLGESSGTTAYDSSGNGHDGTYVNSVTLGATGLVAGDSDKAVTFPGSGTSGVSVPQASWMEDLNTFTYECIIKPSSVGGNQTILSRDDLGGSSGARHSLLYMHGSELAGSVHTGTDESDFTSGAGLTNGVKYHVVMTFDGLYVRAYLNGVLCPTVIGVSGSIHKTSGEPFRIGFPAGSNQSVWNFAGVIDEVSIFDHALTADQIREHYLASGV